MREDDFDLGDLIWVDFEFEDDEKGTLHPAIVLEDQGGIIAVLSGTSYQTPEHLLVRNEMFTSFEISPYCIEHENARTIKHETYFQLEIVRGVKSDKIKSRIGRLNPDRLEELLARCAMRLWFSSDRTEQNNASRWDLICWVRNEHDSSTHIGLEDLNLGVVVGKLKNGNLLILRECEILDGSLNSLTFFSSELPSSDIAHLSLESKPTTISSEQVSFVIDRLSEDHISKIRELPYIKFSKDNKGELGKPKDSSLVGKVVCLKDNKEKPFLVVGYDEHHFYAFEGSNKKQPFSKQDFSCDLPGFQEMIYFDINITPIVQNLHTRRFIIDRLRKKDLERLQSSRIVNALKSLKR
jgi:hypothetical protein